MLYLYDNAIVEDLEDAFNPEHLDNPVVKVISPEQVIGVAAQVKEDQLDFPIVTLERSDDINFDSGLSNFTRTMIGVPSVIDTETNNIYYEKAIPIKLAYTLSVFTTNQADMDEILREIIFKYSAMYFLCIKTPYECTRPISFGITIDYDTGISKQSGISEYTESGKLYQSSILLNCEGCVLLNYTPVHLKRNVFEIATD